MNCLNRVEIQEYIDNEIAPARRIEIEAHLEDCHACKGSCEKALIDKELVKKIFTIAEPFSGRIPTFRKPGITRRKRIFIIVAELVVAASLIGLILFVKNISRGSVELPVEEIIYQDLNNADLNKLWHEKAPVTFSNDNPMNQVFINL